MELTPSQIFSLNEMGIPVWALRSEDSEYSSDANQYVASCDCLVLIEADKQNQKISRLLRAMLFSIGLSVEHYEIINTEQLSQLQNATDQQRLLLVFGEQFAQSLWGSSVVRGTSHTTVNPQISTVLSLSLDELITSPQNKVLAWQDLQLAKQILNAF